MVSMLGVVKPARVHNKDRAMGPVRAASRTNKAPHNKVLLELLLMRAPKKGASRTPVRTRSMAQVNKTRRANKTLVHTSKPDQANRTLVTTDKAEPADRTPVTMGKADQASKTPQANKRSNSQQMTVHTNPTRRLLCSNNPLPTLPAIKAMRVTHHLRTDSKARTKHQVHCMAIPTTLTSSVHSNNRNLKGSRTTMAL